MEKKKLSGLLYAGLVLFMLCASPLARANDYSSYLAEVNAFEKLLGKKPEQAIRYADGEKGRQLQALLQPERVQGLFDRNFEASASGNAPYLPNKLGMIHAWYERAFEKKPDGYEAEYLDIQANEAHMVNVSLQWIRKDLPADMAGRSLQEVYALLPNRNDKEAFGMLNVKGAMIQTRLRKQISDGLFSAAGAARAAAIANSLQLNS